MSPPWNCNKVLIINSWKEAPSSSTFYDLLVRRHHTYTVTRLMRVHQWFLNNDNKKGSSGLLRRSGNGLMSGNRIELSSSLLRVLLLPSWFRRWLLSCWHADCTFDPQQRVTRFVFHSLVEFTILIWWDRCLQVKHQNRNHLNCVRVCIPNTGAN